jgi:serine/threonine protein kinase
MSQLLKIGQSVFTETTKTPCKVEQFLGDGGQGEVYQGSLEGTPVAIKWYFPSYLREDPGLRDRLNVAIKKGAPTDRFLWPQEFVAANNSLTFGYVMPLREPRFKSLYDMMRGKVHPSNRVITTAGFELAHSYSELHAKGLCYMDINFGNVFLDPNTGEIRVCDNDNVDVNGVKGAISGTPGFQAPEVTRGEAVPSKQTDLHSLAVLLFYMFMMHHPLHGRKEYEVHILDPIAKHKLYGLDPLFIFDPHDQRNAPVPGEQETPLIYWHFYPQFLRDIFTKAFTKGLHDPSGRVSEWEWKEAMLSLRDSIIYCGHCGKESFFDDETHKKIGSKPTQCWGCQQELKLPPYIRIGRNVTMLNYDTVLYPHHLDYTKKYDFSLPLAAVTQNQQDGRWGLKNLSRVKWTITLANGRLLEAAYGRSVPLAAGAKINFGINEGEICFA